MVKELRAKRSDPEDIISRKIKHLCAFTCCECLLPPAFTTNEDICWTSVTNPSVRDSAVTDTVILNQDK